MLKMYCKFKENSWIVLNVLMNKYIYTAESGNLYTYKK